MGLYRVIPGNRNWQIETAILASFLHYALKTGWLGMRNLRNTIGLFYTNYRNLLEETLCLVADFISVCLETFWGWVKNVVSISRNDPVVGPPR
jgi:hypothetical protein